MSGRPCSTPCSATRWPASRGALARSNSAASGFFFWGMIDEPDANESGSSQKPNSSEVQRTISAPSRDRWVAQVAAAASRSSTKSRLETASIEFGDTEPNPSSAARRRRSVAKLTPASAPAPSGRRSACAAVKRRRSRSRCEHPEIRQQMVGEVHGLGALEVGIARHRPVQVLLGSVGQRRHQRGDPLGGPERVRAHEHRDVGGDLVVARARRVQLAARRPGQLGHPALDRRVDVLVVGLERKAAARRARCSTSSSAR